VNDSSAQLNASSINDDSFSRDGQQFSLFERLDEKHSLTASRCKSF